MARCTAVFRETGAAILFFGALAQQADWPETGRQALQELAARGYAIPTEAAPVRVFPAVTGGDLSARHAGGWRPGSIFLRPHPQNAAGAAVYLRHELMHEASFRTCGGKPPVWAEEAAAMAFSGELPEAGSDPDEMALERLRETVRLGAPLEQEAMTTLGQLVAREGWPSEPCAMSSPLEQRLGAPFQQVGNFGYLLASLASGRILEAGGDQQARLPPGSLLKIPYAAALREADPGSLGAELAASDTAKLLQRKPQFDLERYRLWLSPVADAQLGDPVSNLAEKDDAFWRRYLGERNVDGSFPFEANLAELAWVTRAAYLSHPAYFAGLAANGNFPGSTLYGQAEEDKSLLRALHGLAKTGTVSDARGNPLVGHLLVLWPAEKPAFLAVFRQRGSNGASVLRRAAPLLRQWRETHPARFAAVRVRLLSLAPRSTWDSVDECPTFSASDSRVSLCGHFRIVSSAKGSRSERRVAGILHESAAGPVVLETDSETYADAVLDAEAQHLKGAARAALRAVIVWNGSHGDHRHADSDSLCDTSHCMVFLGETLDAPCSVMFRNPAGVGANLCAVNKAKKEVNATPYRPPGKKNKDCSRRDPTDPKLLTLLDNLARTRGLDWLPFAKGGAEPWERRVDSTNLARHMNEAQVLDLRRERRKDGTVFVHLAYANSEEVLTCEVFRNTLKLPSCPDSIHPLDQAKTWLLQGLGAGHGQGLSVTNAHALSEAGHDAEAILRNAYGTGP